jgi:hypothetical protein
MRFRKLRIAWTVAWVLACLALLVLWALSYSEVNSWDIRFGSSGGTEFFVIMGRIVTRSYTGPPRIIKEREEEDPLYLKDWDEHFHHWGFSNGDWFSVPIWLPVMLASALAVAHWIPWSTRFSIRTILILTTLVAAVLGLIVFSVSK